MTTITLKYRNDRETPQPEYISLEEETDFPSHPRLWEINVKNPTVDISRWYNRLPPKLAAPEVAEAMLQLEGIVGIINPISMKDWKRCGIKIKQSVPVTGTVINWPDLDIGKPW